MQNFLRDLNYTDYYATRSFCGLLMYSVNELHSETNCPNTRSTLIQVQTATHQVARSLIIVKLFNQVKFFRFSLTFFFQIFTHGFVRSVRQRIIQQ